MPNTRLVVLNADGASANIDMETESTNADARQVVVLGDPSTNAAVAVVRSADPSSNLAGVVVRDPNTTAIASGIDRIRIVVDGTLSTVTRLDRVFNLIDGTISTIPRVDRVFNLVDGTITTVTRVDRVMNVIDGTLTVKDINSTAVLPVTASSSSSAVSTSGGTVISPIVGSVIKVFAFALTTTAQVHLNARFTNGAGVSPTEFWRIALQAPAQGIAGANLAVTPPGYLWATASGSTLSLLLDSASLVHYSVGYFRESA